MVTGLSGAGKSTLASEVERELFKYGIRTYVLDGDNVMHGLNKNLGFSPNDRKENIRRIGEVAKLFVDSGLFVITAFISPYREDRDMVRAMHPDGDFIEVYVKEILKVYIRRQEKGKSKISREYQPLMKNQMCRSWLLKRTSKIQMFPYSKSLRILRAKGTLNNLQK